MNEKNMVEITIEKYTRLIEDSAKLRIIESYKGSDYEFAAFVNAVLGRAVKNEEE